MIQHQYNDNRHDLNGHKRFHDGRGHWRNTEQERHEKRYPDRNSNPPGRLNDGHAYALFHLFLPCSLSLLRKSFGLIRLRFSTFACCSISLAFMILSFGLPRRELYPQKAHP